MSKFKIAIAGCGSMSNTWFQYAKSREDCEIVAAVDIYKKSAEQKIEDYELNCEAYEDLAAAIKETGADIVFDVTIPDAHRTVALTAFENGCDVLGEKPMASTMEFAEEMARAAEYHNKFYAVMQNRRYNKNIRDFRQIISSGKIGKPGYIGVDFFLGPHFGGFRDIMDSPLVLDMAIHTFDQARFIMGSDPVSVYCQEFNPFGSWYKGNASAICIFEMSDGSVFCYRGSWCAEGAATSWEGDWRVTGSNGTAIWDGTNRPFYETVVPSEGNKFIRDIERFESDETYSGRDGHEGCLDEMFNALLEARKAETDCTDNIKSMAMVFGAIKSAAEGKKIYLT
jgi:predicted dehydrogenase